MNEEESKPGVWETAYLREDGSIKTVRMVVFEDGNQAHGEEILKPGSAKYDEVSKRHPNLKVDAPHEVELPRTGKGPLRLDLENVIDIPID